MLRKHCIIKIYWWKAYDINIVTKTVVKTFYNRQQLEMESFEFNHLKVLEQLLIKYVKCFFDIKEIPSAR